MKKYKLIIISILLTNICFSQEKHIDYEIFSDSLYSKDKFQIEKDSILFVNGIFEVITVKPLSKPDQAKVFIQRITNGTSWDNRQIKLQETLYSGSSSLKDEIYRPIPQPISNKYLIIDCINKKETIYIIGIQGGNTVIINGYYFALSSDSTAIYTKTKDNKTFYKYNIQRNIKAKISYLPKNEDLKFQDVTKNEKF